MGARTELVEVLGEARSLLARPGNDFARSSWTNADSAPREIDGLISAIDSGATPDRWRLSRLFAPTGPMQEVSLSSGWGWTFIERSARFDGVERRFYAEVAMSYHGDRLPRPYDFGVLIEVYVCTRRKDFAHPDFGVYYADLLSTLERLFGIRLAREGIPSSRRALWSLFENTVGSLLRIATPWDGYLEAGLLHRKLEECGEPGRIVYRASRAISEAARASERAHREMLRALFVGIFGECGLVATSEDLLRAGFDDSKEPDIADYFDFM